MRGYVYVCMEKICRIKLKDIVDFKNHPFLITNDESLEQLVVSIKETGNYEMISGIEEKEH